MQSAQFLLLINPRFIRVNLRLYESICRPAKDCFACRRENALRLFCADGRRSQLLFPAMQPVMRSCGKTRKTFARYRHLLGYVRNYRTGWLLLAVVTLLNIPFALLQPWPMKLLVDNVLGSA